MADENMNKGNENDTESTEKTNQKIKDLQDVDLLTTQANAQLILMLGYYFEYIASMQAIEIINLRNSLEEYDEEQGRETSDKEEEEAEESWKNQGIDADKTALLAAELELYGQTILTRLDYVKYQRFLENTNDKDYTLAKSANWEIYIGSILEELAYVFNLQGAQKLYYISNENPILD